MTVFEQVKSTIDMRTVAEGYGLEISRGGMALCPFHAEKVTEYQKRVREKRAYEEWEKSAWRTLNDYLWLMREWREYAPASPDEKMKKSTIVLYIPCIIWTMQSTSVWSS